MEYICDECGKKFCNKQRLTYHTEKKVCRKSIHECQHCGQEFNRKAHLQYHIDHTVCQKKLKTQTPIEPLSPKINITLKHNYIFDELQQKIEQLQEENKSLKELNLTTRTEKKSKENKTIIPTRIRQSVWIKFVGDKLTSLCYCCGINAISSFNFEAGHIVARSKQGSNTIDNLRPICCSCNKSMHNMNMIDFAKLYYPASPLLLETQQAQNF
jgi:hypothetical protein